MAELNRQTDDPLTALLAEIRRLEEDRGLQANGLADRLARAIADRQRDVLRRLERGVAHDLNNILMVIAGSAELGLLDRIDDRMRRTALEQIQTAARQANRLSRQLTTLAGGASQKRSVELAKFLSDAAGRFRSQASPGATLTADIDVPRLHVQVDAEQLHTALAHLLARAASTSAGQAATVTLRARRRMVDAAAVARRAIHGSLQPGLYAAIEIEDTRAAPLEAAERFFEPFFSEYGKFTGLDMAEVLAIVESHEGAIRLDASAEGGTSMTMLLPATDAA